MIANTIPFPHARKRGPKVKRGPCATLIAFPNASPAVLYARLMVCRYNEPDREEAYAEHLEWAEGRADDWVATHAQVRTMISRRRESLLAELDLLDEL